MKEAGVYQVINKINGKQYVGSTINLRRRWQEHRYLLRRGNHPNTYLQHSWNLHGGKAFAFGVLEYVPDPERLVEREQHYLDMLQSEYNIAPVAGSMLGYTHTEEAKRKISKVHKGRALSEEHKQKISAALESYMASDEVRRKISEALTGRAFSEEHKRKLSVARKGRTFSEETRRRLSKAGKGRVLSEEHRRRISEAKRGVANGSAKLSERDVLEIKALLQESALPQREIAAKYGVARQTISKIKRGHKWSHIGGDEGGVKTA